jgi:hypothetical protein
MEGRAGAVWIPSTVPADPATRARRAKVQFFYINEWWLLITTGTEYWIRGSLPT